MKYTKEQDQFIIDHYGKEGCEYCAIKLKRTTRSIAARANKLRMAGKFNEVSRGVGCNRSGKIY